MTTFKTVHTQVYENVEEHVDELHNTHWLLSKEWLRCDTSTTRILSFNLYKLRGPRGLTGPSGVVNATGEGERQNIS